MLISIFSDSSIFRSDENMLIYSFYSWRIFNGGSFGYRVASNGASKECINMADFGASRVVWRTKLPAFLSSGILANSHGLSN